MKITWVNHASYILESDTVRLIADPWMEGRVFNESWALLAETKLSYADFADITHIWFSHEHPDHFYPPNLKKIAAQDRAKITVLFQYTIDRKVLEFCQKLGFKDIIEIPALEWISLGSDFQVLNAKVKNDTDSWLAVRADNQTLLNLNDCVFEDEKELDTVRRRVGAVDVLLTQFSFASYVGDKGETEAMLEAANVKLDEMYRYVQTFEPKFTIPFASYIWFCHEDNFHMNAHVNKIGRVNEFLNQLPTKAVVLYPGDSWQIGELHDSSAAVSSYEADFADLPNRRLTTFPTVDLPELQEQASKNIERAMARNNQRKLLSYEPTYLHLRDHGRVFSYSFRNGLREAPSVAPQDADISFHSQNLSYCLRFDWGYDTILVAGTFSKPPGGNFQRFMEYEWVNNLNNQGKRIGGVLERIITRLTA